MFNDGTKTLRHVPVHYLQLSCFSSAPVPRPVITLHSQFARGPTHAPNYCVNSHTPSPLLQLCPAETPRLYVVLRVAPRHTYIRIVFVPALESARGLVLDPQPCPYSCHLFAPAFESRPLRLPATPFFPGRSSWFRPTVARSTPVHLIPDVHRPPSPPARCPNSGLPHPFTGLLPIDGSSSPHRRLPRARTAAHPSSFADRPCCVRTASIVMTDWTHAPQVRYPSPLFCFGVVYHF